MILVPIRTAPGQNVREHFRVRTKRVKAERESVAWALMGKDRPELPAAVLLTRVAPSNGLDSDNLSGALKAVRDSVADWLGVDDRHSGIVRYDYAQERGDWGVRIAFGPMCEACDKAASTPAWPFYRVGCKGCESRALGGAWKVEVMS